MGNARAALIPVSIKLALVAWLLVWMPLRAAAYPPASWLSFCAFGAIILVAGVVFESRLFVSWQAVALLVPQFAYAIDAACGGRGTAYLFDERTPFAIRALSLFHFVLPLVTFDAIRRLGYDRRALPLQITTAAIVLPVAYSIDPQLLSFGGVFDVAGRPPAVAVVLLFVAMTALCHGPTHVILARWSDSRTRTSTEVDDAQRR